MNTPFMPIYALFGILLGPAEIHYLNYACNYFAAVMLYAALVFYLAGLQLALYIYLHAFLYCNIVSEQLFGYAYLMPFLVIDGFAVLFEQLVSYQSKGERPVTVEHMPARVFGNKT